MQLLGDKSMTSVPPVGFPIFQTLEEKKQTEIFTTNGLIFGGSGTGKTWFAGTGGARVLFINIGNGIRTLESKGFFQKHPESMKMLTVDITEKLTASGLPETAEAFDMISDVIDFALEKRSDEFDTVVIDDASALKKLAMNKGLELNQKIGKSQSLSKGRQLELQIKAIQDFGVEMDLIEQFIDGYCQIMRAAGKNFIITAHERTIYKKGDTPGDIPTIYRIKPGFTGQTFPDQVPRHFDWVFHSEVVAAGSGPVYRMNTVGDEIITGKCRDAGVFASIEKNPNLKEMLDRVKPSTK